MISFKSLNKIGGFCVLAFIIIGTDAAEAVVLDPANAEKLCEPLDTAGAQASALPPGTDVVSIQRLADEIMVSAGVQYWMLDAVVGTPSEASTSDYAVHVIRLALQGTEPIFREPDQPGWTAEEIRAERLRAERAIKIETSNLLDLVAEIDEGSTYKFQPEGADPIRLLPSDSFGPSNPTAFIVCTLPQPIIQLGPVNEGRLAQAVERFLLRGNRVDLIVEDVDDATTANFSFLKNDNADSSTLSADGFLGFKIRDQKADEEFGIPSVVAYIGYNRIENDNKSEIDTDVLIPGISARIDIPILEFGPIGFNAFGSTYGELIDDQEQDAQQSRIGFELVPELAYKDRLITSVYHTIFEGLYFRPVVSLSVTGSHVIDDGDSEELQDASNFLGFGGTALARFRIIPFNRVFTNFLAETSWTYRNHAIGDLNNKQVDRFTASLSYLFPNVSNVELKFSYENGENLETFQEEEFYKISLGVKF